MNKEHLSKYSFNTYSQFGEDGIINKIFEIIGAKNKVCVEFGAWDGFHLSNTANLWTNEWQGILIEADRKKYHQLVENTKKYGCTCINAFVGCDKNDSIESILRNSNINLEKIDLLSIDIDSNDYYVLASLDKMRPAVIVCEYNPTIPAEIDLYPEKENNMGCSASALVRIAEEKGYRLVSMTDTNCFFVAEEDFVKFEDYETEIETLKTTKYLTYIVTSYSGDYIAMSKSQLPYGIAKKYSGKVYGNFVDVSEHIPENNIILRIAKKFRARYLGK
ncbi:hypothetical protein [Anaeromusa acidaminophila]|uniref:hypothetical protein n=1 Tax=Anaeromusa acidaminophila TaxID=81464 RepID=UPI00036B7899|nr:hypothetical protein [Anaeromusa acidaminophila]